MKSFSGLVCALLILVSMNTIGCSEHAVRDKRFFNEHVDDFRAAAAYAVDKTADVEPAVGSPIKLPHSLAYLSKDGIVYVWRSPENGTQVEFLLRSTPTGPYDGIVYSTTEVDDHGGRNRLAPHWVLTEGL